VRNIKRITGGLKQPTSFGCLLLTLCGEVDIGPATEAVVEIPLRLAVANEHEFVHELSIIKVR
jgi:hypothetical protein